MSDKTRIENNAFKHSDINEDDSDIAMAKFESFIEGAKSRDQELASLREQLEIKTQAVDTLTEKIGRLLHELKQKEDKNRELVTTLQGILQGLLSSSEFRKLYPSTSKELESLLNKHKKNLSA